MSNKPTIEVVDFPDNVRMRRAMYIPNKDHNIFEIIDNSVDEYAAGRCSNIALIIKGDTITVEDDGGGMPVAMHTDPRFKGLTEAEVALTTLHAGGKFGGTNSSYKISGGLHGVGASCVNALSSEFIITVNKEGRKQQAKFSKGLLVENMKVIEENVKTTGTMITFVLDDEIWKDEKLDIKRINTRMQQLAYLNPGLTIHIDIDTVDKTEKQVVIQESYCYPEGLIAYVKRLTRSKKVLTDVINGTTTIDDTEVSIAFVYTDTYTEDIYSFCNNINTEDGGDHLAGARMAINKSLNDYIETHKVKLKDFIPDDTREGIVGVISIKTPQPEFDGQSKAKLLMPFIRTLVRKATEDMFLSYLDENPEVAKVIISKIEQASNARLAAKRARENVRKTKALVEAGSPKGMADCSEKDPSKSEIYLVEG